MTFYSSPYDFDQIRAEVGHAAADLAATLVRRRRPPGSYATYHDHWCSTHEHWWLSTRCCDAEWEPRRGSARPCAIP